MGILKKRSTAAGVLIAVVVIFTVIGINLSASRVAGKTEKMFYNGVYIEDEGYTEKSIEAQLSNRTAAALGLITEASDISGLEKETSALRDARGELLEAKTIGEKYAANERLEDAYSALASALPADAASSDAVAHYLSALSGAQRAIEGSSYNEVSEAASKSVLGGVLSPLRLLVFSDPAESFK